jgi:phage shock protein PspC (stress-responsive transcriptional regulator)
VCGAIGRATNTDPILWRVVLVVLTIFAGIGALAYLIAWLALPAEGDTASPIEALAGRGRSGTSTVLTIIGGVIVLFALVGYFSEPVRAAPLLAVLLLGGALLLLLRDQRGRTRTVAAAPAAPLWPAEPPAAGAGPQSGLVTSAEAPTTPAGPAAPFAPHGPFTPTSAGGGYPPPPPPPVAYQVPRPPRPPKERSRLGLLTFSLLLVSVGVVALLDLAGFNVRPAAYVAAALATVGAGLVIGAWIGRARGLIALGIVLTLALGSLFGVDRFDGWRRSGAQVWAPSTLENVQQRYEHSVGDARLDLSGVDFSKATRPVEITVSLDLGNLAIELPPDVDAVIVSNVDVGNADILGDSRGGLDPGTQTVTDYGRDGPGGGEVRITASVDLGNLEVSR